MSELKCLGISYKHINARIAIQQASCHCLTYSIQPSVVAISSLLTWMQREKQNNIKLSRSHSFLLNIYGRMTKIICTMRLEILIIQDLDFSGQLIF